MHGRYKPHLRMVISLACLLAGLVLAYLKTSTQKLAGVVALLSVSYLLATVVYLLLDRLTGDGFNESVVYHLQAGMDGTGIMDFIPMALVFLVALLASVLLAVVIYRALIRRTSSAHLISSSAFAALLCLCGAIYYHPLAADWRAMDQVAKEGRFSDYYVTPTPLKPTKSPKNLVYVYLESLERTYLDQSIFPGLADGLSTLEHEGLSFTNIAQPWGTGWTIAGMTATQCGIPLVTTGSGGSTMYGMSEFLPYAQCMGDVLQHVGYDLSYVGGAHLKFAGKGKFYRDHGFSRVQGREEFRAKLDRPGYMNSWGLYDDTLFDLAWQEFETLAGQEKPFALFLLTLDTHHPDGYPSEQCKQLETLQKGNSTLDAVACSDYLITRFVEKLRKSPHGEDTIIVLASDHLAMPNKATKQLQEGTRRNLFVTLGTSFEPGTIVEHPGNSFDMAPTVLSLLGFNVEAFGFGRNLLSQAHDSLTSQIDNLDNVLRGFIPDLRKFWNVPTLTHELELALSDGVVRLQDQELALPVLLKLKPAPGADNNGKHSRKIEEIYFQGYWYVALKDNLEAFSRDDVFLWIDDCNQIDLITDELLSPNTETCIAGGQLGHSTQAFQAISKDSVLNLETLLTGVNSEYVPARYALQKLSLKHGVRARGETTIALNQEARISIKELTQLTLKRYNAGDFAGAIEASESVLETEPTNSLAFNNICAARNSLGDYKKGIEACEMALLLDPDYQLASNNLNWAKNKLIETTSKTQQP